MDLEAEAVRAEAHRREQLHFDFAEPCPESYPNLGEPVELFEAPWDEEARRLWFCSKTCREEYAGDIATLFRECDRCHRDVVETNPYNVWHLQFREHELLGYVCLRCYETEILKNGQPRSEFAGSCIAGGMFFSQGNPEPKIASFEEVDGFVTRFIGDWRDARAYNRHALKLIDTGHAVLTAYERLAIGGMEGYVTMFSRPSKRKP